MRESGLNCTMPNGTVAPGNAWPCASVPTSGMESATGLGKAHAEVAWSEVAARETRNFEELINVVILSQYYQRRHEEMHPKRDHRIIWLPTRIGANLRSEWGIKTDLRKWMRAKLSACSVRARFRS